MIVIVFGVAASGKSTVGRAVAESLGWVFFDGDDFHSAVDKARMQAGVPLGDVERIPWLQALAHSIARHVEAGRSAVYACSALKRAYRALLVREIQPDAARLVFLQAPRAVLRARLARRTQHFFPATLLESQLRDLEPPADDEPVPTIWIDATQPVAEAVRAIREELGL